MLRILVVTLAFGCGGKATVKHEPEVRSSDSVARPRAEPPWVAEGGCVAKQPPEAACVTVTIADAAKIREVVIEHLEKTRDMPDQQLAMRLTRTPIAQWTTLGYRFHSEPDAVLVFEAFEARDGMRSGFRATLAKHPDWKMTELKMFSEVVPR